MYRLKFSNTLDKSLFFLLCFIPLIAWGHAFAASGPKVSLKANSISVALHGKTTLQWSSKGATSCKASGAWKGDKALSGTETIGPLTKNEKFRLECRGPGGKSRKDVRIKVNTANTSETHKTSIPSKKHMTSKPSISLTAESPNGPVNLTWSSKYADTCEASGAWRGKKASSGSESIGSLRVNRVHRFTLKCRGPGGNSKKDVRVKVKVDNTFVYNNAPTITLLGMNPMTLKLGNNYIDPGAMAKDDKDGDVSDSILIDDTEVNMDSVGTYTVYYTVSDSSGNKAMATRKVEVVEPGAPRISLLGANPMTLDVGQNYIDPGATAMDDTEGDLTEFVVVDDTEVDTYSVGTHVVYYTVSDSDGKKAQATRKIIVAALRTIDRPWENLVNNVVGFGSNTTGGKGGELCWVTNLRDTGNGSLRECAESDAPKWIRFKVSGTIDLSSSIKVKSNKTIDGRGQEITITSYGLKLAEASNIIIHNIRIQDGSREVDDAIMVKKDVNDVWIDHVSMANFGDGLLDITRGSTDVTVSWCRFEQHNKTMLIGHSPTNTQDQNIRVTLHHNFFNSTGQRHPSLRYGKVHSFNNYIYNWRMTGIWSRQYGQLASENNIYEPVRKAKHSLTALRAGKDTASGFAQSRGDWFVGGAYPKLNEPEKVFDPRAYYDYDNALEPADADLRNRIMVNAGWQDVPAP